MRTCRISAGRNQRWRWQPRDSRQRDLTETSISPAVAGHRSNGDSGAGSAMESAPRLPLWPLISGEALTGMFGHAGLQLLAQAGVVEITANQHDLILALPTGPVAVID